MNKIEVLRQVNDADFERMHYLMGVLSEGFELRKDVLQEAIKNAMVLVVRDHNELIVGSATLSFFISPTGRKASIEDVVVDPSMQGKGIGRLLVERLLEEAKKYAPIAVQLTSRPARVAANKLYQSMGFVQHETNVYKLKIS